MSGTGQITGGHDGLVDVKRCIREALEDLDEEIPAAMYDKCTG